MQSMTNMVLGLIATIFLVATAIVVAAARCGEVVGSDLLREVAHDAIDYTGR